MDHQFCPGAKLLRQPKPEIYTCPGCGGEVEIWSDELKGKCLSCGTTVMRDAAMSCLDWCALGKECIGETAYGAYMENRKTSIRSSLISELRSWFGGDNRRIDHALKVLEYAESLLKEEGGEWHIVVPAAILHDVGIRIAEEKYGSSAGPHQEKEGPPVARKILLKAGLQTDAVEEICDIIGHHHTPSHSRDLNFSILLDADLLVNAEEVLPGESREDRQAYIERHFRTAAGKELARKLFCPD